MNGPTRRQFLKTAAAATIAPTLAVAARPIAMTLFGKPVYVDDRLLLWDEMSKEWSGKYEVCDALANVIDPATVPFRFYCDGPGRYILKRCPCPPPVA